MGRFFADIIDTISGNKVRRLTRVEQSMEIAKQAIQAEKDGTSVAAKKDQEVMRKRLEEERAAPKKHKAQERKWTEELEESIEKKKEERIKERESDLRLLESVRESWRGKFKG